MLCLWGWSQNEECFPKLAKHISVLSHNRTSAWNVARPDQANPFPFVRRFRSQASNTARRNKWNKIICGGISGVPTGVADLNPPRESHLWHSPDILLVCDSISGLWLSEAQRRNSEEFCWCFVVFLGEAAWVQQEATLWHWWAILLFSASHRRRRHPSIYSISYIVHIRSAVELEPFPADFWGEKWAALLPQGDLKLYGWHKNPGNLYFDELYCGFPAILGS